VANAAQCDTYLPQKARAFYINYNSVVIMITPSANNRKGGPCRKERMESLRNATAGLFCMDIETLWEGVNTKRS
jgi:hypothetical protein